jgi:hypothetical protein
METTILVITAFCSLGTLCALIWLIRKLSSIVVNSLQRTPVALDSIIKQERCIASIEKKDSEVSILKVDASQNIVIGDPTMPLIEIQMSRPAAIRSKQELPSDSPIYKQVKGFIGQLLGRASGTILMAGNSYTLIFSPEVARGIENGTYKLIQVFKGARAWAVDAKTGKFIEHGVLQHAFNSPVFIATMVWSILAAVTAQKFLKDISKQLSQIQSRLDSISGWLEAEEAGELLGNYFYLRNLASTIGMQNYISEDVPIFLVQLENIDRDCLKLSNRAIYRINMLKEMLILHKSSANEVNPAIEDLCRLSQEIETALRSFHASQHIRTIACQLRVALSSEPYHQLQKEQDISEGLVRLEELCNDLIIKLAEPIPREQFSHILNIGKAVENYASQAKQMSDNISSIHKLWNSEIEGHLSNLRRIIEEQRDSAAIPLRLEVGLDESLNVKSIARI